MQQYQWKKAKGEASQDKREEINSFWCEDIRADKFLSQEDTTHTTQ